MTSTAQTVLESTLTACDVEEVLPAGSIHLDVSLSDVVLVFAQCQVTVLLAVETDQRLAVTTTLLAQAQRHAAPKHRSSSSSSCGLSDGGSCHPYKNARCTSVLCPMIGHGQTLLFLYTAAIDKMLIRYDIKCYFNVRSKADISQLNLPHGTNN